MVVGPSGRDHDSQNQLLLTLKAPRYSTELKKNTKPFLNKYEIWRFSDLGHRKIQTVSKKCHKVPIQFGPFSKSATN